VGRVAWLSKMNYMDGYQNKINMHLNQNTSHAHEGFTLLLASLIASILLTLALFMISIAQREVFLSTLVRESHYAFYAADAGAECALFWDFQGGFDVTNATHDASCSGTKVGDIVAGESSGPTDRVLGGQGFGTPSHMEFEQAGRCVMVTVTKTQVGSITKTHIDSRGYNVRCSNEDNPRRLERAVQMTY
jgi:hypothetical protein